VKLLLLSSWWCKRVVWDEVAAGSPDSTAAASKHFNLVGFPSRVLGAARNATDRIWYNVAVYGSEVGGFMLYKCGLYHRKKWKKCFTNLLSVETCWKSTWLKACVTFVQFCGPHVENKQTTTCLTFRSICWHVWWCLYTLYATLVPGAISIDWV
jgi:hypothetical protein